VRKLWGGRFDEATDVLIERLNNSLAFDSRLWRHDIDASIAHAAMLGKTGILEAGDAQALVAGLEQLRADLDSGAAALPADAEDVHTAVEGLLRERLGAVAGRLHTARSRNDQVTTDIRLYTRDACDRIDTLVSGLQQVLIDLAERESQTILPGCTHLQHAQPILLSHHLLAYFWMLDRDRERLRDARGRLNRLPLGAGALAGTGFPIDREMVARDLGFETVLENSLDAVADRDFVAELLGFAAILMAHVSRLAEEIVLWNSPEFGFIELHDSVTTGSSMMPQKKNPDVAELARGKTGRVFGDLMAILVVLKGLPLAYNKDLQEDKEPLFDALDTLELVIPAMSRTLETARFRRDRMLGATQGDFSTTTDLADLLVRRGLPFRQAHDLVGRIVRDCIDLGIGLEALSAEQLASYSPLLAAGAEEAAASVTVQASIAARSSRGGTAPGAVQVQIDLAKTRRQDLDRPKR
jgi:argininosuccinate lyase